MADNTEFYQRLGTALGQGYASGKQYQLQERLNELSHNRLQEMEDRQLDRRVRQAQSLPQLQGLDANTIKFILTEVPENRRQEAFNDAIMWTQQNQQQPTTAPEAGARGQLPEQRPQIQPQQQRTRDRFNEVAPPSNAPIQQQFGYGSRKVKDQIARTQEQAMRDKEPVVMANQAQQQPVQQPVTQPQQQTPLAPESPVPFPSAGINKDQLAERRLALQEAESQRKAHKEDRSISSEARKELKPYHEKADKSRLNLSDYDKLIKLAESGEVRTGNVAQLMSALRIENWGRNLETQEANKIIARLAQNVAGVFGTNSRVTNFLEKTFQRSLPDLWNTAEGIIAITKLNSFVDEANIAKEQAAVDIVKENKGRVPADFTYQINERSKGRIDQLERQSMDLITGSAVKTGTTFNDLPPAAQFKGKKIFDQETGKTLTSDGINWV